LGRGKRATQRGSAPIMTSMNPTKRPLTRYVAAALAILLLLPVPGFAITFLGSWQFFVMSSGGPGLPTPSMSFADNIRGGYLEVNMGEFAQNGFSGSLNVTAIRDFRVNGASELVTISRQFTSLLGDGRIRVTVHITPYNIANPPPFNIPPVDFNRYGLGIAPVGTNASNTGLFIGGNYRVTINIVYEKNGQINGVNTGYWKNSSPHRFTFFGI
jgi:hypothetical protein